jgi:hypothetical protein
LAVTELYVQLTETARQGTVAVERFDSEPDCWRSYSGTGGERQLVKPDAYVVVTSEQYEDRWFVEIDRATESPAKLKRHADTYRRYWQASVEQAKSGVFPKVLFVVPDRQRAEVVVKALASQPAEAWQLFQVVVFDRAVDVLTGGEG